MSEPTDLNDTRLQEALREGGTLIVSFGGAMVRAAPLAPVLRALAERDGLRIVKADIDECPIASARYAIRAAPTTIVFEGGTARARHVGTATRARLLEMIGS